MVVGGLLFVWLFLPYDNAIRLALRWQLKGLEAALKAHFASDQWLAEPPAFPVDFGRDTVVILKTGYGTRDRVQPFLEAIEQGGGGNGSDVRDLIIVGDYAGQPWEHFAYRGQELPVHDVVARTASHASFSGEILRHPRILKHQNLKHLIKGNGEMHSDLTAKIASSWGWELDALKFIPSLEFAYERFHDKKWYILADDDTFLVQPTLKLLLEHLDPRQPYYLGNPVGDFRARFAHGGSAVILSQEAMHALFVKNTWAVSAAYAESLEETWGDRQLAKTLIKIGIYADENYGRFFNGEPPRQTKIRADRLCSPIASFHKLAAAARMSEVGKQFAGVSRPVRLIDMWNMFEAPTFQSFESNPIRQNWDHVGTLDESTMTVPSVASAPDCFRICTRYARTCMAWTWEVKTRYCHISPSMIVGEEGTQSQAKRSGINVARVQRLQSHCPEY
ncbi:glycoprotein-N-acetylgalactosamine 3-beta-galactosyltransferase [Diplogelasinospora grovesii]|uniref:N-acetylgalactosaminide beta-1,3-galactosyltransferase n=1 Tax=Diplogelasinospora grovesii TaxID=303347 RepID=A0AAN6S9T1_9PEZI|nr:glycoprotein-N-acetylgalactosamine 3-beta-galactosyltransferase [Diplogelasinospora grovesii]